MKFPMSKFTSDVDSKFTYGKLAEIIKKNDLRIFDCNNDKSLVDKYVNIVINDIKVDKPKFSSQHIVFFGVMKFKDNKISDLDVCIKLRLPKQTSASDIESSGCNFASLQYINFTQKHTDYVLYNYNLAEKYIDQFNNKYISINTVFCCKSDDYMFWVEKRLKHFDRFNNKSTHSNIDSILTTDIEILQKFQKFVYIESGYQYTIMDLQGEYSNEKCVLCDIEFTFANLYDFTSIMLLDRVITIYNWQKVNLGTIKKDVDGLRKDVSELKSDVSELKSDVSELKSDVSELKSDVSVLKSDVSVLKSDVSVLKSDVGEIKIILYKLIDHLTK